MSLPDRNMVLRYIVPFSFGESGSSVYENICKSLQNSPLWNEFVNDCSERDVFEFLSESFFNNECGSNVGSRWKYDFKNKKPCIRYRADKKSEAFTEWQISELGLFVFRTNIAFIWYELVPAKSQKDISDCEYLINMQSRFKELNRTEDCFEYVIPKKSKDDTVSFEEFSLSKWLYSKINPIFGKVCYLYGECVKDTRPCPNKALIFNGIILNDEEKSKEKLKTVAYLFSNGYTVRYRISNESLLLAKQPFEDVCWYASKGGCGYYAYKNEYNGGFFGDGIQQRIRNDYFFLYILALYQSYSLLNFSRRSTKELSANPAEYYNPSSAGERLDLFACELNAFLMKGIYTSVSNIQHQNDFYEYLAERLLIEKDVQSLKMGVEALVKLQRVQKQKAEELQNSEEEKRRAKQDLQLNFILSIISVFSVFSAIKDATDLINQLEAISLSAFFKHIISGSLWSVLQLIIFVLITVMSAVCIILLLKNLFSSLKIKKDISKNK